MSDESPHSSLHWNLSVAQVVYHVEVLCQSNHFILLLF